MGAFDHLIPQDTGTAIDPSRPALPNADGSFSTEQTITIEADGQHYLIPTIVGGKRNSPEAATALWQSGQNPEVGVFPTAEAASAAAVARSNKIGQVRGGGAFDHLIPKSSGRVPERKLGAYGPERTKELPPPLTHSPPLPFITEPLMAMATGLGAYLPAIAAGVGAVPLHAAGAIDTLPEDVRNRVQESLTYQPQTPSGKAVTGAISWPFEKFKEYVAEPAGRGVTKAVGGDQYTAASDPAGMAGNYTTEAIMQLLNLIPGMTPGGQRAAGIRPPKMPPIPGAKDVEAARLGAGRETQMRELPVPISQSTVGQVMRDPVQLRRETQIAQTEGGAPIRDVHVEQNRQLLENLDVLRGRTGGKATTESDVGRSVTGELGQQSAAANARIDAMYDQARAAGELQGEVNVQPLLKHLREHDDPSVVSFVVDKLRRLKSMKEPAAKEGEPGGILIKEDEFSDWVMSQTPEGPIKAPRKISLEEAEAIRRAASRRSALSENGTERHYAREVVKVIDEMTEGSGGDAYKAARAARKAYGDRFEEPAAIDQLLSKKSRTDRTTALEDVWDKTVNKGSIVDLQRVRDTLQATDTGKQSWRELAGQTVDHIREAATKSAALDEAGRPNLSPAALKRVIDSIGDDKLRLILGDTAARQLRSLSEVAADLKTKPPTRIGGSDTGINLMLRFNRIMDHIPVLGTVSRGIARVGAKMYEEGRAGRDVQRALRRPADAPPDRIPIPPGRKGLAIFGMQEAEPDEIPTPPRKR